MNWELQPSPVFWLPVPYANQSLMDVVEWRFHQGRAPETIELTNPKTNLPYRVAILDFVGPYPVDRVPSWLARHINPQLSGAQLAALLLKRVPEFKHCKQILFYQVIPYQNND
jgi:hypothetical protein